MKKVLFVGMVFGALAFTSCEKDNTKDYKCTYDEIFEGKKVHTYNDVKDSEVSSLRNACEDGDGVWSVE